MVSGDGVVEAVLLHVDDAAVGAVAAVGDLVLPGHVVGGVERAHHQVGQGVVLQK